MGVATTMQKARIDRNKAYTTNRPICSETVLNRVLTQETRLVARGVGHQNAGRSTHLTKRGRNPPYPSTILQRRALVRGFAVQVDKEHLLTTPQATLSPLSLDTSSLFLELLCR